MGVLVLGMHRSGTSALAGALEAMGLEVGPDADVMPGPTIGNPEGLLRTTQRRAGQRRSARSLRWTVG